MIRNLQRNTLECFTKITIEYVDEIKRNHVNHTPPQDISKEKFAPSQIVILFFLCSRLLIVLALMLLVLIGLVLMVLVFLQ